MGNVVGYLRKCVGPKHSLNLGEPRHIDELYLHIYYSMKGKGKLFDRVYYRVDDHIRGNVRGWIDDSIRWDHIRKLL